MNRFISCTLMALLLCAGSVPAAAGTIEFILIPSSGLLSAMDGVTQGWGYQIGNSDSLNWLEITALDAGVFDLPRDFGRDHRAVGRQGQAQTFGDPVFRYLENVRPDQRLAPAQH